MLISPEGKQEIENCIIKLTLTKTEAQKLGLWQTFRAIDSATKQVRWNLQVSRRRKMSAWVKQ
jgi:hypothetical protein